MITARFLTDNQSRVLGYAFDHHMFDLGNRFGRIEPFGANLRTVHDGVTAIQFKRIFQIIQALTCRFVTAID